MRMFFVFPVGTTGYQGFPMPAGQWERFEHEVVGYGYGARAECVKGGIAAEYSQRQMRAAQRVYQALEDITEEELDAVRAERATRVYSDALDAFAGIDAPDGTALEDLTPEQLRHMRENLARCNQRFVEDVRQ